MQREKLSGGCWNGCWILKVFCSSLEKLEMSLSFSFRQERLFVVLAPLPLRELCQGPSHIVRILSKCGFVRLLASPVEVFKIFYVRFQMIPFSKQNSGSLLSCSHRHVRMLSQQQSNMLQRQLNLIVLQQKLQRRKAPIILVRNAWRILFHQQPNSFQIGRACQLVFRAAGKERHEGGRCRA